MISNTFPWESLVMMMPGSCAPSGRTGPNARRLPVVVMLWAVQEHVRVRVRERDAGDVRGGALPAGVERDLGGVAHELHAQAALVGAELHDRGHLVHEVEGSVEVVGDERRAAGAGLVPGAR